MSEWKTIESAPKDENIDILGYMEKGFIKMVTYCKYYDCWVDAQYHDILEWEPTHWQPLPEPPKL